MLELQSTNATISPSIGCSNPDVALSFCQSSQPPLPYLVGVGQRINAPFDDLSHSVENAMVNQFITQLTPLLLELEPHLGNDFLQPYLSKSHKDMLQGRCALFNTILETISDIGTRTQHNPTLFTDLYDHQSLFSLLIQPQQYENYAYQLAITCEEPFFVYNIDETEYPEFLQSWLCNYIRFLANAIGAETISKAYVEYEIELELEQYECASEWSVDYIEGFKRYLTHKDITTEQKTAIEQVQRDLHSHCGDDDETLNHILQNIIDLAKLKKLPDEVLPDFETLQTEFIALKKAFPKSRSDKNSQSYFCQTLIEQQLEFIADFGTLAPCNDFANNGDMPMALNVIVDTNLNLNHPAIDLDQIGESRWNYGETAQYSIDTKSPSAIKSIHLFAITEYFIWQLCNIHNLIEKRG